MKKIIPALAMLLISAIVMSTASFAWFSMNENVVAEGMSITAQASGSLIISESNANAVFDGATTIDLGSKVNYVNATTYKALTEGGTAQWLKADGKKIDGDSGAIKDGATDALSAIVADDNGTYYVDYLVYVASAGSLLTGKTLSAGVSFKAVDDNNGLTGKALSVAFFVLDEQDVGKNAEGFDADVAKIQKAVANDGKAIAQYPLTATADDTGFVTADDVVVGTAMTIPSAFEATAAEGETPATTKQVLPIVMRVYFDGDRTNGATGDDLQHFVNSQKIDTTAMSVSVDFKLS